MKCRQIKELMGAYIYGDLSPDDMREVRLHTTTCGECRQDLQTRSAALEVISDRVPELTDLDKQRISWYVEGAVRRSPTQARVGFRLAPVLGGAAAIAAGIAIGALIASNLSQPVRHGRQDGRAPVHATVKIQEEPAAPPDKDKSETDLKTPDDASRITSAIADGIRSAFRGGAGVAARGHDSVRHKKPEPEEVVEEVPTRIESPANEPQDSPTKLPNPTNVNDARTSPAPDGQ